MKKTNKNQGITLIALIITIIVMLILVAVTITIAVNGGLFNYAKKAHDDTIAKRDEEQEYVNLGPNMSINQLIDKYTTASTDTTGTLNTTNPHTGTGTDIGDIYTIGTENFYVIGSDATTVTLLAVKCLGYVTKTINDDGAEMEFLEQCDITIGDEFQMAEQIINVYAISLGLTVQSTRFMTKDEADALKTEHADILYGTTTKLNYFLNTIEGEINGEDPAEIWTVDGSNSRLVSQDYPGSSEIRPIIVVAKTNL